MTEEIKNNKISENSGNNQGMVGKGKPPKEYQFKPGQSGNPAGKPPGTLSLVSMLKEALREMIKEKSTGEMKEKAKALIEIYLKKAIIEEDARILIDIINRIDGMPKMKVDFKDETEPEKNKFINLLKSVDDDTRKKLLEVIGKSEQEGNEGSDLPGGSAPDDRKGNISECKKDGGLETGGASQGMEQSA